MNDFDPLNQIIENTPEIEATWWPGDAEQAGNRIFVYDLETVPDFRHQKPEEKVIDEDRVLDKEAILKTVDTVKAQITDGISKAEAEELLLSEQSRAKPRKGAIDLLRGAVECSDKELQSWKKLATKPWECRIVALGIFWYGMDIPVTRVCTNDEEEKEALELFWKAHACGRRCGYNIRTFDDQVIIARSLAHGVFGDRLLNTSRYDKSMIDLELVLFGGPKDALKLKDLVRRMGIEPPAGDIDGSHVNDLFFGGQLDMLQEYVFSDCIVEMELLKKLQNVVEF